MAKKNNERGVTLVFVVLLLVVLLGMAALAVDLGVLYTARTSSQHAADAAALTGAATYIYNRTAPDPKAAAENTAINFAQQREILGTPIAAGDVTALADVANRRVRVTISRPVATFFGRVLGILDANITTVATAEASEAGSGAARCVKPIFVPNTLLAPDATFADACANGHVLFNPDGTLSQWAKDQNFFGNPTCNNFTTIRPIDSSKALEPSQYYSIDFGSGGNTYRCSIASCLNDPECGVDQSILNNYALACNKQVTLPTENGGMSGPTKQGVDDLLDLGPDTFTLPGTITNSSGQTTDTSYQNSAVPVWDNCEVGNEINSGKQSFRVIGLAEIFITGYANGPAPGCAVGGGSPPNGKGGGGGGGVNKPGVQAWVRNAIECGAAGGGGPTPVEIGPLATPIKLIQND